MRTLLNTLFVLSEDSYLSLDGENVVVNRNKEESARFPLHTLEGILSFAYAGGIPGAYGSLCTARGRLGVLYSARQISCPNRWRNTGQRTAQAGAVQGFGLAV